MGIRSPRFDSQDIDEDFAVTDASWSKRVRARDNHRCMLAITGCRGEATSAHHIYARSYLELRFWILNGLSVCEPCHHYLEIHAKDARELIGKVIPPAWMRRLKLRFEMIYGYDIDKEV